MPPLCGISSGSSLFAKISVYWYPECKGFKIHWICFRIQEKHSDIPCIPVSARTECFLQQFSKDSLLDYEQGADNFCVKCDIQEKSVCSELDSAIVNVLKQ